MQRQRSQSQTGWVVASKSPPTPGPDGPCPSQGDLAAVSLLTSHRVPQRCRSYFDNRPRRRPRRNAEYDDENEDDDEESLSWEVQGDLSDGLAAPVGYCLHHFFLAAFIFWLVCAN